jgi:hypothetical protein
MYAQVQLSCFSRAEEILSFDSQKSKISAQWKTGLNGRISEYILLLNFTVFNSKFLILI